MRNNLKEIKEWQIVKGMVDFKCRVCKHTENEFLISLGHPYLSGFTDNLNGEFEKFGLALVECSRCGLVQLYENIELDKMYKEYWYRSGLNPSMVDDLKDVVRGIENKIDIYDGDVVIDIGCNDGTMFNFYTKNVIKIGYDPSLNVGNCSNNCTYFINDYFPSKENPEILKTQKATVITAIAMFYDLPDPNMFLRNVRNILDGDGIFVVQFTDLLSMFKLTAFDNICHEHLEYYRLADLDLLFRMNDLTIIDVEYNKVNGGSIRVYATHSNELLPDDFDGMVRVKDSIRKESILLDNWKANFEREINHTEKIIRKFLNKAREQGKRVCGLGASTKGNTLLQYYKITNNDLESIGEINEDKFGLFTVGSWIPIVPEKELMKNPPDFLFILPWHFTETFLTNFLDYMVDGGVLIFPLPYPVAYYYDGNKITFMQLNGFKIGDE